MINKLDKKKLFSNFYYLSRNFTVKFMLCDFNDNSHLKINKKAIWNDCLFDTNRFDMSVIQTYFLIITYSNIYIYNEITYFFYSITCFAIVIRLSEKIQFWIGPTILHKSFDRYEILYFITKSSINYSRNRACYVSFIARMFISIFYTPANIYSSKYSLAQDCFNVPASTFCLQLVKLGNSDYDPRGSEKAHTKQGYTLRHDYFSVNDTWDSWKHNLRAHSWLSLNSQPKQSNVRLPFIMLTQFGLRFRSSINLVRRNVCT